MADDSDAMRKIILRSLSTAGISDVVEAADGDEIVALFSPGRFDIVLTDFNMPGSTGLEIVAEIRRRDKDMPIIALMTEAETGLVPDAIRAGASDHLVKPFAADALRKMLKKHLMRAAVPG